MATHSSILETEEPGGLQSIGSQRVGHDPTEATWHTKNAKERPVVLAKALHVDMFGVTHSSVLAWRIPGMGEPGGLPSMGSRRVGHD